MSSDHSGVARRSASDAAAADHILRLFEVEAAEHIEAMNADLLAFESDVKGRRATLARILRAAHSLKGSAAVAGLEEVERQMHVWEACAAELASEADESTVERRVNVLFRSLDSIQVEIVHACTGDRTAPADTGAIAELRGVFGVDDLDSSRPASAASAGARAEAPLFEKGTTGGAGPGRGLTPPTAVSSVRVAVAKIDRLMSNVEELVQVKAEGLARATALDKVRAGLERLIAEVTRQRRTAQGRRDAAPSLDIHRLRADLESIARDAHDAHAESQRHGQRLSGLANRLQDDIRSVRMVPAEVVLAPLARAVRDVARRLKRFAVLRIEGGETEIDRDLVDALKDAVMHLLRNAVSHGVETPAERVLAGKPEEATIVLTIEARAGGVDLRIRDDGRGVSLDVVRGVAVRRGHCSVEEARDMSDAGVLGLLFRPGFSTAADVDQVSGRGVGLDVVRSIVERCGGSVGLTSEAGTYTEFVLRMPVNLTTMRVLLVRAGGDLLAVPLGSIAQVARVERQSVRQVSHGPAIELAGRPARLVWIHDLLQVGGANDVPEKFFAVVVASGNEQTAIVVDGIDGEQEVVVKGLGEHLADVPGIAGAAILATGRIAPIVSVSDALGRDAATSKRRRFEAAAVATRRRRILVVDDSITTRTLEKSILEALGYEVDVATDGVGALAKLRDSTFDLVLSDVQMPKMDGIELVTRIKRDERLREIPVVLVSSLGADEDRQRGLQAGADAYVGKGEFRQELLVETLERLL